MRKKSSGGAVKYSFFIYTRGGQQQLLSSYCHGNEPPPFSTVYMVK